MYIDRLMRAGQSTITANQSKSLTTSPMTYDRRPPTWLMSHWSSGQQRGLRYCDLYPATKTCVHQLAQLQEEQPIT
jgi:hypothetical protein